MRREAVEVLAGALTQPEYGLLEPFQEGRVYYPRCVWTRCFVGSGGFSST